MTSKQFYSSIDNRFKKYSTVANGSYNNISLPYASGTYGVYRRIPHNLRGPPYLYTQLSRHIDSRNKSHHFQQHRLANSVTNDNDYLKYGRLNSSINTIYHDEKEEDDEDDDDNNNNNHHHHQIYSSEIFNYTFPVTDVSFLFQTK